MSVKQLGGSGRMLLESRGCPALRTIEENNCVLPQESCSHGSFWGEEEAKSVELSESGE